MYILWVSRVKCIILIDVTANFWFYAVRHRDCINMNDDFYENFEFVLGAIRIIAQISANPQPNNGTTKNCIFFLRCVSVNGMSKLRPFRARCVEYKHDGRYTLWSYRLYKIVVMQLLGFFYAFDIIRLGFCTRQYYYWFSVKMQMHYVTSIFS